jgi:hypothetical protein
MKKFIVAILAILYMGISSGVAMDIHYCMGKEISIEFYSQKGDGKCDKCGMKDKKGCCGDEHKFYKLADSHKNVSNDINLSNIVVAILTTYGLPYYYLPAQLSSAAINNYSPPDYARPSYCVMNSVFRI